MVQLKEIPLGGLTFNIRVSGKEGEELVIFLHGFPETSHMWTILMEKVSSLGFHCVAPDMRGYSPKACPRGKKHYSIKLLSEDILNLASAFNKDRFHLIGHDWGAAIGWNILYQHTERIISWTGMSVPHTNAFGRAVKKNKDQQKRSRYIKWFMVPILPEFWIRRNNFKLFRKLWKHSSKEEVAHYLDVFSRRGALTAALNYYRANMGRKKFPTLGKIKTPTLFIWGKYDVAIGKMAAEGNHKYMDGDYTYLALEGGHWLIQTNYSEVEAAIIAHLTNYHSAT